MKCISLFYSPMFLGIGDYSSLFYNPIFIIIGDDFYFIMQWL